MCIRDRNVAYPGAAPAEVEKGVCMRIEEAVDGVAGIKRLNATASEGAGTATIDALPGTDIKTLLEEVKMRVDAITTFPEECEKPLVQELILRRRVLEVAVHGEVEYSSLRKAAEKVRDGLSSIDGVSLVQLTNARPYEISIELSETALRRHQLNFDQVAAAGDDAGGGAAKVFVAAANGQIDAGVDDVADQEGLRGPVYDDGNVACVSELDDAFERHGAVTGGMVGDDEDDGGGACRQQVFDLVIGDVIDGADFNDAGAGEANGLRYRRAEVDQVSALDDHLVGHARRIGQLGDFAAVCAGHTGGDGERDAGGGAGGDAARLGAGGLGDGGAGALL